MIQADGCAENKIEKKNIISTFPCSVVLSGAERAAYELQVLISSTYNAASLKLQREESITLHGIGCLPKRRRRLVMPV